MSPIERDARQLLERWGGRPLALYAAGGMTLGEALTAALGEAMDALAEAQLPAPVEWVAL